MRHLGHLALTICEQSCHVEQGGSRVGVGLRLGVAAKSVDVRQQRPLCRPSRRVFPVREGGCELAGGQVAGGLDGQAITVGVAGLGGTGHGLHQPMHGKGPGAAAWLSISMKPISQSGVSDRGESEAA